MERKASYFQYRSKTSEDIETTVMDDTNQISGYSSEFCNLCRRNFQNKTLLKSHHVKHHYIRKCPNCYKPFRQTKKYLKHLRTHINDCPYECKICLKSFNSKAYLRGHMVEHKNSKKEICKVCSEVCDNHLGLVRHMMTHGRQPYECTMCNSIFSTVADRFIHIKNHIIRCVLCKVNIKNEDALINHIKRFHRKKKYVSRGRGLRLQCPDFVIRANCDSSDSMEESSLSDEDSDSSMSNEEKNADIVSVYKAKHKDNYICFICLQLCATSEWLKCHMEAHTWFPCPYCPKFFSCNQDLDLHKIRNHSHFCTKCDAIFKCESDLNLHKEKCSWNSNLNSELMEKTVRGDCKLSNTIENVSNHVGDLFTQNDAHCHSERRFFSKIPHDEESCKLCNSNGLTRQIANFLGKLAMNYKRYPAKLVLELHDHFEKMIKDCLQLPPSKLSEDEREHLEKTHFYLSGIMKRYLSIIYNKV